MRVNVDIDPIVLVAAERYALRRWLTAASELVASSILDNVAALDRDQGAQSAIVNDVIDMLKEAWVDGTRIGSQAEWDANHARWRKVAEAIIARMPDGPQRMLLTSNLAAARPMTIDEALEDPRR